MKNVAADLLKAARLAAEKHSKQQRKDPDKTPYINHALAVAETLATIGGITNLTVLQAALLHDTIEDTATTPLELKTHFGPQVCDLVLSVTDDKSLPKEVRKQKQIAIAPLLPLGAQQIKIADKICNVSDITSDSPVDWPISRKLDYLTFAESVVLGCRGANRELETCFQTLLQEKRALIAGAKV